MRLEVAANIALSLTTAAVFALGLEGLARALEPTEPRVQAPNHFLTDWQAWDGDFYTVKSTAVGWPPWEDYNHEGLRDREHAVEKPRGVFRVVALGDSVTLGFRLRPDEAWPQQLQDLLAAEGSRAEVLNVALGGWSTRQELIAYRRIARAYRPDLVVLGVCLNDLPELQNNLGRPPRWLAALHRRSAAVRLLVRAEEREVRSVEELVRHPDALASRAAFGRFFAELTTLDREVRADGARLAALVFPFRFQVDSAEAPTGAQDRIISFCREQGIPCFDLLPLLRGSGGASFLDEPHLTAAGGRRVAEFVLASGLLEDAADNEPRAGAVPPPDLVRGPPREGDVGEALLLRALRSGRTRERVDAVRALGRTSGSETARRALRASLADRAPEVRAASAWSLGRLADPLASPRLAAGLADADPRVRAGSAWALGRLGRAAQRARPALRRALSDPDEEVRWRASASLSALGPDAADLDSLVGILRQPTHPARAASAQLLGALGPAAAPAVPALVGALADRREEVRARATQALGQMGPAAAPAVPALVESLGDESIRWKVVEALRTLGPVAAPAAPALVPLLRDQSGSVRWRAARALSRLGPAAKGAVPDLQAAALDSQANIRLAALTALARLGDDSPEGVQLLERALHDEDARIRERAAESLGNLGSSAQAAVPSLSAARSDPDDRVRSAAAAALEHLRQPERRAAAPGRTAVRHH